MTLKEFTVEEYYELKQGNKKQDERYSDTVFAIPDYKVPYLKYKLEPFFKKADKLDVPYVFEELGKVILTNNDGEKEHCMVLKLEFKIQINGWKFIAAIDHLPNGNIIRNISGEDLPEKFRTVEGRCEHCNTNRPRKATYVVYNEEEGFKQVGKSCLFLYTGINLNKIAFAMDVWNYISSYGSGEEEYDPDFEMPRASKIVDAREVLAITVKLVNLFGYSKATNKNSTVDRYYEAVDYINGDMKKYYGKTYEKYHKFIQDNNIEFFAEENFQQADEIIKWVGKQKAYNDYMHNLKTLFDSYEEETVNGKMRKTCYVSKNYTRMIISAVNAYNRAMGIKKEKETKESKSEHVGKVGDKVEFTAKDITVITSWESCYGYYPTTTYIYKIIDENENVYTWKTSVHIGEERKVKGTIKEHKEFNGEKQTELTRCKIN